MPEEDFDISSLAKYLHLTPQQVEKLAKRNEIPSRMVGGKQRFSRAEVHHWMEARMGVLGDSELAAIETRLQSHHSATPITVAGLMSLESIAVPLPAKTRGSVINNMTKLAASTGRLWDADKMAEAVRAREELQSTAMDNGVALLHPRRPLPNILAEGVLALGITSQGIPFGGSRELTDIFWLLCSVDDRTHLQALARISRLIASEDFLAALRESADEKTVLELIQQSEAEIDD